VAAGGAVVEGVLQQAEGTAQKLGEVLAVLPFNLSHRENR